MSTLRPECTTGGKGDFCPPVGTALLMTLNAVSAKEGLAHGKLHRDGYSCAVGSFFDVNPKVCYPGELTEEVAAVNDSMPQASPRQRKLMVVRWLRWRLGTLGMPGFERYANKK